MATTPPTEAPGPLQRLARAADSFGALSGARRELIILGVGFAFGLIVMPFLIFLAGSRVLGPYTHGENTHAGPFALLADYFVGLFHGSAVFWMVALGPAVLLVLIRGFLALLRTLPPPGRG
ncbi:MAG: hypothetical protein ACRETG_11510 [Steroidobacteraceae bacterium]